MLQKGGLDMPNILFTELIQALLLFCMPQSILKEIL